MRCTVSFLPCRRALSLSNAASPSCRRAISLSNAAQGMTQQAAFDKQNALQQNEKNMRTSMPNLPLPLS